MIETIDSGKIKWYHILNPSDEDLNFLKAHFDFHELDIEDCKSVNQRPKIDIYPEYNFLILHFPYLDKANKFVRTKEVKIFWGENYIVTIGKSHWVVKSLFNSFKENPTKFNEAIYDSSDGLLYVILDRLMVETYSLLLRLGGEVELINRELFNKKAVKTIERISVTRKNIILINTIFKPQLRLFHKFESGDIKGFTEGMEDYWGNILDYYQKMWDMVEDYAELIEGLSKTFDSLQTNRINEIMKILTFFSSIMLPLTMLSGMYGMNVNLPLQEHPYAFWIVSSIMGVIVITLLIYFKRKKWM